MAQLTVESSQTVEMHGIDGPNGADRVFITNGIASLVGTTGSEQTYTGLIDPTLQPGQFRRAIAHAAWSAMEAIVSYQSMPGMVNPDGTMNPGTVIPTGGGRWLITAAEADWDDESGRIELRVTATGTQPQSLALQVAFQVMTFAAAPTP
jgi:hypothetical protein